MKLIGKINSDLMINIQYIRTRKIVVAAFILIAMLYANSLANRQLLLNLKHMDEYALKISMREWFNDIHKGDESFTYGLDNVNLSNYFQIKNRADLILQFYRASPEREELDQLGNCVIHKSCEKSNYPAGDNTIYFPSTTKLLAFKYFMERYMTEKNGVCDIEGSYERRFITYTYCK